VSLALAVPVAAGPFEDGLAAHARGDYAAAMRLWRPLADQGNANAQNNLGAMYARAAKVSPRPTIRLRRVGTERRPIRATPSLKTISGT
jgi:TPR repeat protein